MYADIIEAILLWQPLLRPVKLRIQDSVLRLGPCFQGATAETMYEYQVGNYRP